MRIFSKTFSNRINAMFQNGVNLLQHFVNDSRTGIVKISPINIIVIVNTPGGRHVREPGSKNNSSTITDRSPVKTLQLPDNIHALAKTFHRNRANNRRQSIVETGDINKQHWHATRLIDDAIKRNIERNFILTGKSFHCLFKICRTVVGNLKRNKMLKEISTKPMSEHRRQEIIFKKTVTLFPERCVDRNIVD